MPGDGLTSLASLAASLAVFLIVMALGLALNFAALRTRRHHIVERLGQPEQRAEALLKQWLCPEQRATLDRCGYFEVKGSHSGKWYRIRYGRSMNIDELGENGVRAAVWCFGPEGRLPLGDVMLAQKLALETDELAALAVANRSNLGY